VPVFRALWACTNLVICGMGMRRRMARMVSRCVQGGGFGGRGFAVDCV
jgi:hypothetical protein